MCLQSVYGLDPQDDTHKTKYGSPTTLEVVHELWFSSDHVIVGCVPQELFSQHEQVTQQRKEEAEKLKNRGASDFCSDMCASVTHSLTCTQAI